MIVIKFGGTSLESTAAIQRAAEIVKGQLHLRPVVVVSALGKTTDELLTIASVAARGNQDEALERLASLEQFHLSVSLPFVPLEDLLRKHFQSLRDVVKGVRLLGQLTPRSLDAIASYGERLSSDIVTLAFRLTGMNAVHLDSQRLILTDSSFTRAMPVLPETYARVSASISAIGANDIPVMGGFIGATVDGIATTLGRGGSDFTAAIVGAALRAEEIQIWTDVDGVLTCDPKLVPDAHLVKVISFNEAAELAYFGAKVLHPATILPAKEQNIPVRVLNSRRPVSSGTTIVADAPPCKNVVKSVACKNGITTLNIQSTRMLMAHGFLSRIFETFNEHGTAVDMVATSEVSVSLTIDDTSKLPEICSDLSSFTDVSVERDQAILCIVGDKIRDTPGIAARMFGALEPINVRMISQGASLLNIGVVVASRDLRMAAEALHREFFGELDRDIFD